MTNKDLNQIDELLKKRLADSEGRVMVEVSKFIEDEILPVLESHTQTLESQTQTLNQIAVNTETIKENNLKLDKRLSYVEDKQGIVPPPELTIAR